MLLGRDLTRLFVKIVGLIILLTALVGLPWRIDAFIVQLGVIKTSSGFEVSQAIALLGGYVTPFVVYAVVGLGLIWWSGRVVDRFGSPPERSEVVQTPDLRDLETILVAVLGLYFFADGIAEICRWSFSLGFDHLSGRLSPFRAMVLTGDLGLIVQAVTKLIIGILLMLGRGGSAALRRRLYAWVQKWRTWPR